MSSPVTNIKHNPIPPSVQPPTVGVGANLNGFTVTYQPPAQNTAYTAIAQRNLVGGVYTNQNTTYYGTVHRNGYIQGGVHQKTDCVIL